MSGHVEIVHTDAEQPWHVRLVGANGEPIAAGELSSEADAQTAVCAIARLFGWGEPRLTHGTEEPWQWVAQGGWPRRTVPVEFVDERANPEPCS